MTIFPPVPEASSPGEPRAIAAEARRLHAESIEYWNAYTPDAFFHRASPELWAPADQVRHLTKSIRAVNQGLHMPRLVLFLLFGWSRRASRTLEALRADYEGALAGGGKAGLFTPRDVAAADQTEAGRGRIMSLHAAAVEVFARAIEGWPERALDRYRLPHPLLGRLSVREMAYFTLLHNVHHVAVAERRRRAECSA